jgi:hypothetical protein
VEKKLGGLPSHLQSSAGILEDSAQIGERLRTPNPKLLRDSLPELSAFSTFIPVAPRPPNPLEELEARLGDPLPGFGQPASPEPSAQAMRATYREILREKYQHYEAPRFSPTPLVTKQLQDHFEEDQVIDHVDRIIQHYRNNPSK